MRLISIAVATASLLVATVALAQDAGSATGVPHWLTNSASTDVLGLKPGERGLFLLDPKGQVVTAVHPRGGSEGSSDSLFDALGGLSDAKTVTVSGKTRPDGSLEAASFGATVRPRPGALGEADAPAEPSRDRGTPLDDGARTFFEKVPGDASAYSASHPSAAATLASRAEVRKSATGVPHWLENRGSTDVLGMKPGERRLFLLDPEGKVVTALSSPADDPRHLFAALGGVGGFADDRTVTVEGRALPDGSLEPATIDASVRRGLPDVSAFDSPGPYWTDAVPAGTTTRVAGLDRLGSKTLAEIQSADGRWRTVPVYEVAVGTPLGRATADLFGTIPTSASDYAASHPEAAKTLAGTAADPAAGDASPEVLARIRGRSAGAAQSSESVGMARLLEQRTKSGSERVEAGK